MSNEADNEADQVEPEAEQGIESLSREKGVSGGGAPCPACGRELSVQAQRDGSLAADSCPSCYPTPEIASEGQNTREVGTEINVKEGDN